MLDFTVDAAVGEAALQKLLKHSWYLNEETVMYALSSESVSNDCKKEMARKLISTPHPVTYRTGIQALQKSVHRN